MHRVADPTTAVIRSLEDERPLHIHRRRNYWEATFKGLGGPCTILVRAHSRTESEKLVRPVAREVWRIEAKFSRYRDDGWLAALHGGAEVLLDAESMQLLALGEALRKASGGKFDLTAGVLRKAWRFGSDGTSADPKAIDQLLTLVGWDKVDYRPPHLRLAPGMQLDFGGIGKEYAVDRCLLLFCQSSELDVLINLGGDIAARSNSDPWHVGIEGSDEKIAISEGALATSGTSHRFVEVSGRRYGHIIDALNGWPVSEAPQSVTVVAASCCAAGAMATTAMLQGAQAASWLRQAGVRHWLLPDKAFS